MPTDKKIEEAIKPLVEMYSEIETDLLKEIASHFLIGEEFENADYYRIKKLEEMGAFNQKTIEYLSRKTGVTQKKIKECLEQIGIDTINTPELSKLYDDGVISVNPDTLMNNSVIQAMISSAYNDMNNRFIDLSSKIEKATREAYLNVLERSYLDISMRTHSYDEAIRKAINDLSNEGISTMSYVTTDEDGNVTGIRNYDIEGVVRRDALTGARQLSGELNQQLIEETECEYVKFSEHLDCRESHFPWQGTIVKASEWKTIANYGDVAGIYGINCRHYVEPYFGDKRGKAEKEYKKKDCENAYKFSQKQRYLERGVRNWKRKKEMFKTNGDKEAYQKSKEKVDWWNKRLDDFTEHHKLNRDYSREYVRTTSDRKINAQIKADIDNMKVGTFDISKYSSDITTTTKDVILTPKQKTHITKNHPDVVKYIGDIGNILNNHDSLFLQLDKPDTVWLIKQLDDNVKITMKLNTTNNIKERNYKNSIIQMQIMKQNRINNYVKKGKLQILFDINEVK